MHGQAPSRSPRARSWLIPIVSLLILLGTAGQAPSATAATLRVPSVYPTVQDALEQAVPGDVVQLEAGVHLGSVNAQGLQGITIRGAGLQQTLLIADTDTGIDLNGASQVVVEGLKLQAGLMGITLYEAHDITLQDLEIEAVYGIASGGAYNLYLRRNHIFSSEFGYYSYRDWGRSPQGSAEFIVEDNLFVGAWVSMFVDSSLAMRVRRNHFQAPVNTGLVINSWDGHQIYENLFEGGYGGLVLLEVDDEVLPPDLSASRIPGTGSGIRARGSRHTHADWAALRQELPAEARVSAGEADVLIYNNVFYRTGVAGIYGEGIPHNAGLFWTSNNIYYQNGGVAVYGSPGTASDGATWNDRMLVRFSTFYGNAGTFGGVMTLAGKRAEARNQFSDPRFVAPEAGDFNLQDASRCIDSGTLDLNGDGVSEPMDYAGRSRDRGLEER